MLLALGVAAILLPALLGVLASGYVRQTLRPRIAARARLRAQGVEDHDPGRELRAEQRARALLRSCVNEEEWAMYSELGFLCVRSHGESECAYLLYPHRPILAYAPHTGTIVGEYCVEFPDRTRPYGSSRLPDADDVLAKWVALTADERSLIEQANMHLPGRQIDLRRVRRDLARLGAWERSRRTATVRAGATGERLRAGGAGGRAELSEPAAAGSVPTL